MLNDDTNTNILSTISNIIQGIVPCTSLLKQHVQTKALLEPSNYLADSFEQKKRNISIIGAQEDKQGSIVSHLISAVKALMNPNQRQDLDDALKAKTADSLRSHVQRSKIMSS